MSQANLLRVHREQQQILQQKQQEADRQQQLLLRLQEQAAIALQCVVRGWLAKCQRRALEAAAAETAAAAAAVITAAVHAGAVEQAVPAAGVASASNCEAVPCVSSVPSVCSRGSDSSCSSGSSRQNHSRGSTVCSLDVAPPATTGPSSTPSADAVTTNDSMPHAAEQRCQSQPVADSSQQPAVYSEADSVQYELPGLVIRSTAEMRSASHGGVTEAGVNCREDLARQLVQRAGQLGVCEGQRVADIATRAVMASSSFRQLPAAMGAVRTARTTT